MRIQPIDPKGPAFMVEVSKSAPASKFRLKKLFERQFTAALRYSSADRAAGAGDGKEKEPASDFEPSSLCLAGMVQNFMESGPNERPPPSARCGRRRCNCFNGNCDDLSDDDLDFGDGFSSSSPHGDAVDLLKSLVPCATAAERNLLVDASKFLEKNSSSSNTKSCSGGKGNRGGECRKMVVDGLTELGHNASICLSRWEKTPSFPAGEYEYLDVILPGGDRIIVDLDFRSEFEIARSTKSYRAALQALPTVFVGREDRLSEIIALMSDAARQSMKKKGLHIPPWRKPEYLRAKWLSPVLHTYPSPSPSGDPSGDPPSTLSGELELRCEESGRPAVSPAPSPAPPPSSSPAPAT